MAAICNLTVKSPPLPFMNASFTSTEAMPSFTVTDVISISLENTGYFCALSAFNIAKRAALGVTLFASISMVVCFTPEPSSVGTKKAILTFS